MKKISNKHKMAIVEELNKRQERIKLENKKQKELEEAKKQRKEKRAALRERHKLNELKEKIQQEIIKVANLEDFNVKLRIYDVKDPAASNDGIIVIGGFIGEIILTFTCLLDFILAQPQNESFQFTTESIEQFLMDLLCADDSHFPDASIVLQLNKAVEEIAGAGNPVSVDTVLKYVKDQSNISDFGLHFMMDVKKDLVLSQEVIDVVFKTVTKICVEQPKAMLDIPAKPDGAEGDAEEEYNNKVEEIKADNEKFTKENAQLTKIKAKVVLKHKPESMQNDNEKALLKINNFTNEVLDADGKPVKSARTDGSNPEG